MSIGVSKMSKIRRNYTICKIERKIYDFKTEIIYMECKYNNKK